MQAAALYSEPDLILEMMGGVMGRKIALQVEALAANAIPCVRHIGFAGAEEERAWQVLSSKTFQQGSGRTLHSLTGLALQDDMTALAK